MIKIFNETINKVEPIDFETTAQAFEWLEDSGYGKDEVLTIYRQQDGQQQDIIKLECWGDVVGGLNTILRNHKFQTIKRLINANRQYCSGSADDFINAYADDKRLPWSCTPPAWLESEMLACLVD